MKLTRGERKAAVLYLLLIIGFMPPVINWVVGVKTSVLGLPFPLFWASLMIFMTFLLMTLAYTIKERSDRK